MKILAILIMLMVPAVAAEDGEVPEESKEEPRGEPEEPQEATPEELIQARLNDMVAALEEIDPCTTLGEEACTAVAGVRECLLEHEFQTLLKCFVQRGVACAGFAEGRGIEVDAQRGRFMFPGAGFEFTLGAGHEGEIGEFHPMGVYFIFSDQGGNCGRRN